MCKELNDDISKKGVMYKKVGDESSKKVHLLYTKGSSQIQFFAVGHGTNQQTSLSPRVSLVKL